jgi:AraC-like DNA-binding protein
MPHCAGMTAAVENVHMVVAAAARRGVPPGKLLAAVGLDPQSLLANDGRVPAEPMLRLWRTAAELCGDPGFGLSLIDHLHPYYVSGLGFAVHGSATFGDALRRLARFFALVNQHGALELVDDGPLVRVRFVVRAEIDAEELRHPAECVLAVLLWTGRRTTGAALQPVAVGFRHAAPTELAAHERTFGVAPRFEQPWNELVFARAALATPQLAPSGEMTALAERRLHRQVAELPPIEAFTGRVRRVLLEELQLGEPTLARLAARLRMSERTVQRRLSGEGASMQALLDEARRELSLRRLAESNQSIAEISFLLGFAEVRAFHRAFKRWTGSTPAAYRQSRSA